MARAYSGFTMIEIVAVLAIVAILALMAVPGFQERIIRDQIAQAIPLADIAKVPVALSWSGLKSFPKDNADADLPPAEKIVNNYISAVAIESGAIQITFGNNANGLIKGKILSLRPAVVLDAVVVPVTWVCGEAAAPGQMTVQGTDRTNIPASYLPVSCRGP